MSYTAKKLTTGVGYNIYDNSTGLYVGTVKDELDPKIHDIVSKSGSASDIMVAIQICKAEEEEEEEKTHKNDSKSSFKLNRSNKKTIPVFLMLITIIYYVFMFLHNS